MSGRARSRSRYELLFRRGSKTEQVLWHGRDETEGIREALKVVGEPRTFFSFVELIRNDADGGQTLVGQFERD